MKTLLMEKIGGKMVMYCILSCLLWACDTSVPLTITSGRKQYSTTCGKLTISGSRFGSSFFLTSSFDGSFSVNPNSLRIEFFPKFVRVRNLTFSIGDKRMENNDCFQVNNNYVVANIAVFSEIPVNFDTVTMVILPCDYIMCEGKPLINDTIRLKLK